MCQAYRDLSRSRDSTRYRPMTETGRGIHEGRKPLPVLQPCCSHCLVTSSKCHVTCFLCPQSSVVTTLSPLSPAQTVSFLTYLLRSYAEQIRPHEAGVASSILSLLRTCPDIVASRKVSTASHIGQAGRQVGK